ncbi:MAG: hypothetical protein LBM13_00610, partial [Candidatus Ancillula sp.]|nr:hypothetical protein [Candidatus Ancillula sp.]
MIKRLRDYRQFLRFFLIFSLSFALVSGVSLIKSNLNSAKAYSETPIGFDATKRLPYDDPDLGIGVALGTDPNGIVPIQNVNSETNAGLVRVVVASPDSDVQIFSCGADILQIPKNNSASTTFLTSFKSGGVNLYADKPINARVEVVASFQSTNQPGSVHALDKAVLRADSMQDLSGKEITKNGGFVGVTGQGGVPSENVRAVFYTATITTSASHSFFEIAGNEIEIPDKGITHISSVAVPDSNGNLPVAIYRGDKKVDTSARIR